ncbi:transcriptional regulator, MarR family [Bifidobacterium dolichotidis]|uniref:Transcriptional regulator, MarR family n=1 Tax=Bifidobacterium dolichotidis TaxID=2306976 RepID=A0A430FRU2_9BIFI|nr:MarR family winged helix-turn-helix transcriptional regulator [Bifidobacterium dolichotidis]RSX55602.1 transcriptional regulator, MarR family [Bifidobacterium dolichotidis]
MCDAMHLGLDVRSLHNLIRRTLSAMMPPEVQHLSAPNVQLLIYLSHNEDHDVYQHELDRVFSITRSTDSRVLSLMEKKGLIERKSVDHDARLRKIVLTDSAREITKRIEQNANQMEEIMLQGFSHDERIYIHESLQRMKSNLLNSEFSPDPQHVASEDEQSAQDPA